VFLNHDQESVVIAVRGSLSLEDCITDVIADPVEMAIAGETWGFQGKGKYAHGGFLASALYIREELERSQVLTSVFGTGGKGNAAGGGVGVGGVKDVVTAGDIESQANPLHITSSSSSSGMHSNSPNNIRAPFASFHGHGGHGGNNNYPYAHYQLVIVGHSLGAAAAAILALMLRPHYPRLHCYAYGIPGCVLDQRSATESCEYITAGVYVTHSLTMFHTDHILKIPFTSSECHCTPSLHPSPPHPQPHHHTTT
jgi:sn1-specific diacylglycerol lipase